MLIDLCLLEVSNLIILYFNWVSEVQGMPRNYFVVKLFCWNIIVHIKRLLKIPKNIKLWKGFL